MPWESSNRKSELPSDWDAVRQRIGDRDGWRCQWPRSGAGRANGICGQPANQCDHKEPGGDHSETNLWMLCRWHHNRKTQEESTAGKRALADKGRHPVERHPGLL
jgi:5-methylcytosine-specific restriction endonuclease McrA